MEYFDFVALSSSISCIAYFIKRWGQRCMKIDAVLQEAYYTLQSMVKYLSRRGIVRYIYLADIKSISTLP